MSAQAQSSANLHQKKGYDARFFRGMPNGPWNLFWRNEVQSITSCVNWHSLFCSSNSELMTDSPSARHTRLRPVRLALYSARSASRTRVSSAAAGSGNEATPMDAV